MPNDPKPADKGRTPAEADEILEPDQVDFDSAETAFMIVQADEEDAEKGK